MENKKTFYRKLLFRIFIGALCGIAWGHLFGILASLHFSPTIYSVPPELLNKFNGNLLNAVIFSTFSSSIIGISFSGLSFLLFYNTEKNLFLKLFVFLLTNACVLTYFNYINYWINHNTSSIFFTFLVNAIVIAIILTIRYLYERNKIMKLNKIIQN